MRALWDVAGLGAVSVDDLVYVRRFPKAGGKMGVLARRREGGGLTATALVAASRLGARAAFFGILGHDELSRYSLRELVRAGVDCRKVLRRSGARPGHSTIVVVAGSGQRTILASGEGVTRIKRAEVPHILFSRCRVALVDHTQPEAALEALEVARRRGIPAVADLESLEGKGTERIMLRAAHLIVGEEFARAATGERDPARAAGSLDRLRGHGGVVVTAGERGCWYASGIMGAEHVPAFRVKAVDTTGCGDVFHGAYAAALAQGRGIAESAMFAGAAAALKAGKPGGRSGIPDGRQIQMFLKGRSAGG